MATEIVPFCFLDGVGGGVLKSSDSYQFTVAIRFGKSLTAVFVFITVDASRDDRMS